jgi:predicted O-methyltransferase YrrM
VQYGDYKFSADWFSHNIPSWENLFSNQLCGARKFLEIGAYEGRSAVWVAERTYLSALGIQIYCIDTWSGGEEHDREQMAAIEARFDHNIEIAQRRFVPTTILKLKGPSHEQMVHLLDTGHRGTFDFLYIDGSHQTPDVLGDLFLAFLLCRVNGVIACDDYLWGEGSENILHRPKLGIDAFAHCFAGKLKTIHGLPLYQLYMIKVAH